MYQARPFNLIPWKLMSRLSIRSFSVAWLLVASSRVFAQSTAAASETTGKSPAFAYLVACLAGLLVMCILCMPSRKR
jgi:hypothetical protein